ncbi:venom carboxylesterase-6-like [Cydia fagiglandana]|uniref:venom carboxylesterase-6-like n=1 Tax=Cydia fagiglandana TaxID=1458189 RepID=UPI002FEE578E
MLFSIIAIVKLILYLNLFSWSSEDIVNLKSDGIVIIGRKLLTLFENKSFAAFWGIPYAEPPVGLLRFKPPKRLENPTKGVYDYSVLYEETCSTMCDEDCLHLNVYMPLSLNSTCIFPVIVWIEETSGFHRPDFFIDENLVVVSVSYRTHILGFLNTEDNFALGNMGAKDILAALKWVRDNISMFNGDPAKVTVIGHGKGATLVASLLISSEAEDLYKRVIIQSGSALSPADYRSYSFEIANKLYNNMNGLVDKFNRTKLYDLLSKASTRKLLSASEDLFDSTEVRDNQRLINAFGPTVEKTKKHAFVHKLPINIYRSRMTNNIADVMMGYTNLESLYKLKGLAKNRKLLKYLNYNFQYLVPFEGAVDEYGSKRYRKILRKIMEFYFLNGTIGEQCLRRYAKYVSDQVIYPLIRQARLHAQVSCAKLYLYRYSFKGELNSAWISSVGNFNLSGATFGDEICYLFRCKSANDIYNSGEGSTERDFIKKITRLWSNFAKYGNPTPQADASQLGNVHWDPFVDKFPLRALNLGAKIKMVDIPEQKRIEFWDEIRQEFYPEKNWKNEL